MINVERLLATSAILYFQKWLKDEGLVMVNLLGLDEGYEMKALEVMLGCVDGMEAIVQRPKESRRLARYYLAHI